MMIERLTQRFSNGQAAVLGCGDNCKYDFKYCKTYTENCPTMTQIYEKLAKYEDLEERGRILELPCNPGDTVYLIQKRYTQCRYGQEFEESLCCGCESECDSKKKFVIVPYKVPNLIRCLEIISEIGKTVFMTELEAEEELEKINGQL